MAEYCSLVITVLIVTWERKHILSKISCLDDSVMNSHPLIRGLALRHDYVQSEINVNYSYTSDRKLRRRRQNIWETLMWHWTYPLWSNNVEIVVFIGIFLMDTDVLPQMDHLIFVKQRCIIVIPGPKHSCRYTLLGLLHHKIFHISNVQKYF